MAVSIVAQSAYCESIAEELPRLKPLVKESVGRDVRRVGRFIQLALIGAGRAATTLPTDAAIYLASGRGDVGAMVDVLDSIYRDAQPPRPLGFINTVSNAACFYVAQAMATQGPSSFISHRYFALEMTLKSALHELQAERLDCALVGVVDAVVAPIATHCERLGVTVSTPLAEGSHWLQLQREAADSTVLATLENVLTFSHRQTLQTWLATTLVDGEWTLALGQSIADSEALQWQAETGLSALDYRTGIGYFESQVGRALCQFVACGSGGLVFLNRDPHGRYVAVVVTK